MSPLRGALAAVWERVPRQTLAVAALLWVALVAGLAGADLVALRLTRVPVSVRIAGAQITVDVDGQELSAPLLAAPQEIQLVSGSSGWREYEVDGTDNTNNFTETPASVQDLRSNPYYGFLSWMRSSDIYSRWVDLRQTDGGGARVSLTDAVESGAVYALRPMGSATTITAELERPEAPATLMLIGAPGPLATLTLDRNDRALTLQVMAQDGARQVYRAPYFPNGPLPYIAEVLDTLLRVLLWAEVLAGGAAAVALVLAQLWAAASAVARPDKRAGAFAAVVSEAHRLLGLAGGVWARVQTLRARLGWCHLAAGCVLAGSLAFELWIALAQFQGQPHILDASAYLFQAKIFASGHLSVAAPADTSAFQGPFMVVWNGRWFAQYPPATSALLALGLLLHAPWAVEPALGTAALLGIYWIGSQVYDQRTALLAICLLAVSPFYAYQAASYLSHTVALAAEVGFLAALLWFVRSHRVAAGGLAGAALGVMFAARELDAVLVGVVAVAWLGWRTRRALLADWDQVARGTAVGTLTLGCGLALYLAYNAAQTGDPLLLPRTLFSAGDRYGFGTGVGFYGAHNLAAGFVNLDQQLTSLLIDLFGWPFYVTLAPVPLAFVRRDGRRGWDALWLTLAGVIMLAQVGYFYHGIYLGPRYLFGCLPSLALLTARGIGGLAAAGRRVLGWARKTVGDAGARWAAPVTAGLLLVGLLACGVTFYWPRQVALYTNYSGLPASVPLDVSAVYHARLSNALILTDNWYVYNYVLWPLNDPALKGSALYAFAPSADDISRLRSEYPTRQVYLLTRDSGGGVRFLSLPR